MWGNRGSIKPWAGKSRQPQWAAGELAYEYLEVRALMAAVAPSDFDQYMVELINRARSDPAGYAQSLGISLNEGLPPGTISTTAKQPLAINPFLTDAARKHSQWILDADKFSHTGAGGSSSRQRMETAGYVFHPGAIWAENLGIELRQTPVDVAALTKLIQEKLFRDAGVAGRGHRLNILDERFVEIGVGVRSGVYTYQGTNYNAVAATQNFAKSGNLVFLTGVAFDDRIAKDQFYTPGEGLGNVTIRAIRDGTGETFTAQTWASGGYSLALPPGKYSVLASGGGLGNSQFLPQVVVGSQNRKIDFRKGVVRQAPEIAVTGNQQHLRHGQTQTSPTNYTDFGSLRVVQGSLTRPFVVRNLGNAPLLLTGANRVEVVGTHRADFSVVGLPVESISGGGFSSFKIRFDPVAAGLRTAIVRVWSNDGDEKPFRFTVTGLGVADRLNQAAAATAEVASARSTPSLVQTFAASFVVITAAKSGGTVAAAKVDVNGLNEREHLAVDQDLSLVESWQFGLIPQESSGSQAALPCGEWCGETAEFSELDQFLAANLLLDPAPWGKIELDR